MINLYRFKVTHLPIIVNYTIYNNSFRSHSSVSSCQTELISNKIISSTIKQIGMSPGNQTRSTYKAIALICKRIIRLITTTPNLAKCIKEKFVARKEFICPLDVKEKKKNNIFRQSSLHGNFLQ